MRALIVITCLLFSSMAMANELPRYDVEAHCEKIATVGGDRSAMMYNGCIDMEQDSYNSIRDMWGDLPGETQQHCTRIAEVGGTGSYQMLSGCIDMETSAANNQSEFSFD